jgi:protein-S-isoprenylcysteine O-methyltransferase Ste14
MDCILIVGFLIHPNILFLLLAVGIVVGIHVQVKGEETHLLDLYGNEYEVYLKSVGRYFLIV